MLLQAPALFVKESLSYTTHILFLFLSLFHDALSQEIGYVNDSCGIQ